MTKKLGPKGNPMGRKAGKKYQPSNLAISWVMSTFLSLYLGIKRDSVRRIFVKEKKSLSNFQDCVDFLQQRNKIHTRSEFVKEKLLAQNLTKKKNGL